MPPRRARFAPAAPEEIPVPANAQPDIVAVDTAGDAEFAARLHRQELAAQEARQQALRHAVNRRLAIEEAMQRRQAQADAGDAGARAMDVDNAAGLGIGPGGAARFGLLPMPRVPVDNGNAAREARNAAIRRFREMARRDPMDDAAPDDGYIPPRPPGYLAYAPWQRFGDMVGDFGDPHAMIQRALAGAQGFPLAFAAIQAQQQQSVEESWSGINFTPRHNPLLGFTYDFDKDAEEDKEPTEIVRLDFDDESPIIEELKAPVAGSSKHLGRSDSMTSVEGKGKGITSLVCAKCNEQLRVSQGQRTEADRVFALRCGHLIDKRCLDDISQPHPELEVNKHEESKPGFVKMGKGKAVESTSRNGGTFVVKGEYDASTVTPQASSSTLPRIVSPHADQQSSSPSVPFGNSEAGSSNQRKPSRTTRSAARATAAHPDHGNEILASDDEGYDTLTNPNGKPPSGKKRKAQSKATTKKATFAVKKLKAPVETREYRWVCPVAACGKEHFSEEIGGVWKPKDGMTVQLFV